MKIFIFLLTMSLASAKISIEKWEMQIDPEFAKVNHSVKDKKFINVDAHALKDAQDVILDAAVYSKLDGTFNPLVRPEPIHICTAHEHEDPLIKMIHDEIIKYGNVTKACPVKKDGYYYLHDFTIEENKIPMEIPTGEFRIDINGSIMDQGKIHHIYSSELYFTITK